jgi:hypothetical protein
MLNYDTIDASVFPEMRFLIVTFFQYRTISPSDIALLNNMEMYMHMRTHTHTHTRTHTVVSSLLLSAVWLIGRSECS